MLRHAMFINEYGCYRYQSFAMFGCVMLILTQFDPKLNGMIAGTHCLSILKIHDGSPALPFSTNSLANKQTNKHTRQQTVLRWTSPRDVNKEISPRRIDTISPRPLSLGTERVLVSLKVRGPRVGSLKSPCIDRHLRPLF